MTTNKFLTVINGIASVVTAIASSGGAGDANKIIATGSDGKIDPTLMPTGIGASTESIQASENLAAGDFVNLHDVSGSSRVRKADASNGRLAHGFVLAAATSGQNATVYQQGKNTALSGLSAGQTRWLSASAAGTSTATPPSTAGQTLQVLGVCYSATMLLFEFNEPIQL